MILNRYKQRKAKKEQKAKELAERLANEEAVELEIRRIASSMLNNCSRSTEEIKEMYDAAQRLYRDLEGCKEEERYIE